MSESMTPEQVAAILDGAKKPFREVKICMRLDLQAEYEGLDEELRQAEAVRKRTDSLDAGVDVESILARMTELEEEMGSATIPFRFEPVPGPKWSQLILAHPARKGDDGQVVLLDQQGVNSDTFLRELIPLSCVWPELPAARWASLLNEGGLTDGQIMEMGRAGGAVTQREGEVPFSRVSSVIRRRSGRELRQPSA